MPICCALHGLIVNDDHLPIRTEFRVQFHPICALVEGQFESREGIFRRVCGGAAMGE
jgi:hypothetical protein